MKTRYMIIGILAVVLVGGIWLSMAKSSVSGAFAALDIDEVTVYKSPSCGCCGLYADYLNSKGLDAKVEERGDLTPIKKKYGVPQSVQSCHTTIIGGYFVEGHIPVEAIAKLLEEQPDIKGIAMPGMPSGSPGMPGSKTEEWVIFAVKDDGSREEFMRI
jgi:hypothetical protein